jgi:hypothetical protein
LKGNQGTLHQDSGLVFQDQAIEELGVRYTKLSMEVNMVVWKREFTVLLRFLIF